MLSYAQLNYRTIFQGQISFEQAWFKKSYASKSTQLVQRFSKTQESSRSDQNCRSSRLFTIGLFDFQRTVTTPRSAGESSFMTDSAQFLNLSSMVLFFFTQNVSVTSYKVTGLGLKIEVYTLNSIFGGILILKRVPDQHGKQ